MAAGREDAGGPLSHAGGVKRLRRSNRRRAQLVSEGDGSGGRRSLAGDGGVAALWLCVQKNLRSIRQGNAGRERVKIQVVGIPCPARSNQGIVFRHDGDSDRRGFAGGEGSVASVVGCQLISSSGKIVHQSVDAARGQCDVVDGRVVGDAIVAGEADRAGGRAGAAGGRHRTGDGGRLAVRKAGGTYAKGRRSRSKYDRTPVLNQIGHVHRSQASGLIVARTGGVAAFNVVAAGVRGRGAGHAVGCAGVAGHLIAAHRHVVKSRSLFCGERIVNEIGLPGPRACALVDESLDGGHGR